MDSQKIKNSQGWRLFSFWVAAIFLVTNTAGAAPSLPTAHLISQENRVPFFEAIQSIPAEMGTVREMDQGKKFLKDPATPFVIHIQDAHANPDAQSQIFEILKFLAQKFPGLAVGVEGAKGTLHPEYLDFFPKFSETGEAVIRDLHEKGELTGAEKFIWEEYKKQSRHPERSEGSPLRIFGVENPELYRDNLKTYRTLLVARSEIETALNPLRDQLATEQSKILNPELRNFLRERDRRKTGKFETSRAVGEPHFLAYLDFIEGLAQKTLAIDLKDPIEQLRFPNLVRVFHLEKAQKEWDGSKAAEEWNQALKLFRAKVQTDSEKALLQKLDFFARKNGLLRESPTPDSHPAMGNRDLYPRELLENFYRLAKNKKIDLARFQQFFTSWRILVFQAEIDSAELFSETESLERALIEKLAQNDSEKKFIRRLENFNLLEKLLFLELTRVDYEKAMARRDKIHAGAGKGLDAFFDQALHFYEDALQRDHALT